MSNRSLIGFTISRSSGTCADCSAGFKAGDWIAFDNREEPRVKLCDVCGNEAADEIDQDWRGDRKKSGSPEGKPRQIVSETNLDLNTLLESDDFWQAFFKRFATDDDLMRAMSKKLSQQPLTLSGLDSKVEEKVTQHIAELNREGLNATVRGIYIQQEAKLEKAIQDLRKTNSDQISSSFASLNLQMSKCWSLLHLMRQALAMEKPDSTPSSTRAAAFTEEEGMELLELAQKARNTIPPQKSIKTIMEESCALLMPPPEVSK